MISRRLLIDKPAPLGLWQIASGRYYVARADRTAIRQAGSTTGFRALLWCCAVCTRNYTGQLSEPIYEPIGGLLAEIMRPAAEERARQQRFLKIKALFARYKIDEAGPNAWRSLAIALALVHVPGMQVIHEFRSRRGRKRSWKAGQGIELVRDVEALRAKRPRTTQEAIRTLKKDKTKGWHVFSEQNLITRHREARRAEQKRRTMAEQLLASPTSQVMGGIFGILHEKTDGIA